MRVIGVIPVRYDSRRFPGKALAQFRGKTILENVYQRACQSTVLDTVIIATDNELIKKTALSFRARVIDTSENCHSGTDRVAQAVTSFPADIIVNIQGDQPLLPSGLIAAVVKPLQAEEELVMTTPICPLSGSAELSDPNIVKVVIDQDQFALYFSRYPIPYRQVMMENRFRFYKHIGVYAYRKDFLLRYASWQPGILECTESLEQLRVLEHGCRIKTVIVNQGSPSIDTAADLTLLEKSYDEKE